MIANCFVTGKWKDSEDANELLRLDDADDLSDLDGDFEDLETGVKHVPKADNTTNANSKIGQLAVSCCFCSGSVNKYLQESSESMAMWLKTSKLTAKH